MKHAQVIRVAGDKVFVKEGAGRIAVYDKTRCTPVPVKSAVDSKERAVAFGDVMK